MPPCRWVLWAVGVFAFATCNPSQAQPVEILLQSGRKLMGEVDVRTDHRHLWLRFGTPEAALILPVAWDRVAQTTSAGRELSPDELRDLASPAQPASPVPDAQAALPEQERTPIPACDSTGLWPPPRVQSIHIEARVANWDADQEADGLCVRLVPLAADGWPVPVRGTLTVDLTAEQFPRNRREPPFPRIGSWQAAVDPAEFGPSGAAYRFEFQARHPEFDLDLAPHGVVQSRLSVPGQGTFDATAALVRIRPYSAVRDRLQLREGTRFFPGEWNGRRQ